jgi:hypothetical protein
MNYSVLDKFEYTFDRYKSFGKMPFSPETYGLIKPYYFGIEVECLLNCFDIENFFKLNIDHSLVGNYWKSGEDISIKKKERKYNIEDNLTYEMKSMIFHSDASLVKIVDFFEMLKPKFNLTCGQHVHIHPLLIGTKWDSPQKERDYYLKIALLGSFVDVFLNLPNVQKRRRTENQYLHYIIHDSYSIFNNLIINNKTLTKSLIEQKKSDLFTVFNYLPDYL